MTRPSTYSECWLVLHVLNEDWDAADAVLADFNGTERAALYEAIRVIKGALIDGRFDRFGSPAAIPRVLAKADGQQS